MQHVEALLREHEERERHMGEEKEKETQSQFDALGGAFRRPIDRKRNVISRHND